MPWRRLVLWETEKFMSDRRSGLTRHGTRESLSTRLQNLSSASIITVGAILTTFVIVGTLALHQRDPSGDENRWTMPLPTAPLEQPELPVPVPVRPAPTSATPVAVTTAPTAHRPSPPSRKPGRDAPAPVVPAIPEAGSRISLITVGDISRRVRHRNFRLRVDQIGPRSPALDRSDATFVVRSGLADKRCLSLEAVNYPGRFVRHQNFALFLHSREATGLFAADATFCAQPAGPTGVFALRAVNYPDRYLTVRHSVLHLSRVPVGGAQTFRAASGL
jgi:hypothetical protein